MVDALGSFEDVLGRLERFELDGLDLQPERRAVPLARAGGNGLSGVGLLVGTRVLTPQGARPVEDLAAGAMVITCDNGIVPLTRVRRRPHRSVKVAIGAGAFGNSERIVVARRQLVIVQGSYVQSCFDMAEVLLPAKALVRRPLVDALEPDEAEAVILETELPQVLFAGGVRVATVAKDRMAPAARMIPSPAEELVLSGARWV